VALTATKWNMTAKLANANFEHVGDATADSFSSPSRNTGWGFFVRICAWTGKVHIGAAGRDAFSYSPAATSESLRAVYIVHSRWFRLDLSYPRVKLNIGRGRRIAMRLVLLVGCLSLSACAVFVTVRLRALTRKPPSFPPIF